MGYILSQSLLHGILEVPLAKAKCCVTTEIESLKEKLQTCLDIHLYMPDQSQHELSVNVRLFICEIKVFLAAWCQCKQTSRSL